MQPFTSRQDALTSGANGIQARMSKLFISHSSQEDGFVRELQQALQYVEQDVWLDSRELRGGDPLWSEIQKAIEEASAFAVVVSTHAFESKWVGKELTHALELQKQRGKDKFRVIALSLDGAKLGVFESLPLLQSVWVDWTGLLGSQDLGSTLLMVIS